MKTLRIPGDPCFKRWLDTSKLTKNVLTGPPQIISRSAKNITRFVETDVILVCTVIGNPIPATSWKRSKENGEFEEIESTSDKFGVNYTIYGAKVEDSGNYVCNASNSLGWSSYSTKIIIKPGKTVLYYSYFVVIKYLPF